MTRILAKIALVLWASACSTPLGNLTIVSTRKLASPPQPLGRTVEGVDCAHFLLFAPIGGRISSSIERAMRQAQQQVPDGNALMDVTVYTDVLFAYVYNRTCSRVRGTIAVLR